MARLKSAVIRWSYPRNIDSIYRGEICNTGWGLYAISRVFGNNETLLYIGLTYNQNFVHRISKHHKNWFGLYRGDIKIRLGEFEAPVYITRDIIEDVESCLIYELQPRQNICKRKGYTYTCRYSLTNVGYRGVLPSKMSMAFH